MGCEIETRNINQMQIESDIIWLSVGRQFKIVTKQMSLYFMMHSRDEHEAIYFCAPNMEINLR